MIINANRSYMGRYKNFKQMLPIKPNFKWALIETWEIQQFYINTRLRTLCVMTAIKPCEAEALVVTALSCGQYCEGRYNQHVSRSFAECSQPGCIRQQPTGN